MIRTLARAGAVLAGLLSSTADDADVPTHVVRAVRRQMGPVSVERAERVEGPEGAAYALTVAVGDRTGRVIVDEAGRMVEARFDVS